MNKVIRMPSPQPVALSFAECWFDAPPERSKRFFPAFMRVSKALQAGLRYKVPEQFLLDVERFRDTRMVYPLLVYAASRPCSGEWRTDFTYDILNRRLMSTFNYWVRQNLPAVLARVSERLRAAGMNDVAAHYRPSKALAIMASVERLKVSRRRLHALLIAETLLVNDLLAFAGSSAHSAQSRAAVAAKCEKAWLKKLRCLFARQDFTCLAISLLAVCTAAMAAPPPAVARAA